MEARSVDEIPVGDDWQYEPKWDGFRCLAFRDGKNVFLQSKAGQPLARYFPDVWWRRFRHSRRSVLSWMASWLFQSAMLSPSTSCNCACIRPRVACKNSRRRIQPLLIVFDLLADTAGKSLLALPLRERRKKLEAFARENLKAKGRLRLSPATTKLATAKKWFDKAGGNLDGIIAKQIDAPYASGERTAMVKVKQIRSADCVVGGFRYATGSRLLGSLLLGLYDDDGLLHHVGFTSAFKASERPTLTKRFEALKKKPGFTGNAPGGPSRWSTERSGEWEPVDPKTVVEVTYDHFTGGRFRHGTKILRWRRDKAPRQCTMDQVEHREGRSLALL